jgi:predicted DNA-binding protein
MIKSISLPAELIERSIEFSIKNGQTFSGLIRISLEEYLSIKIKENGN